MPNEYNGTHDTERRKAMPCADHEKRMSLLELSSDTVKETMAGVSTKLDLILAQITRVAILEEKHQTQQADVTRAHDKIQTVEKKHDAKLEKLEESLSSLAKETREFINYSKGRDKMLYVIGGAVGLLAIKVLFFAASHGMTP